MHQFQEEIVINKSIEFVFEHLTNLKHSEMWAVFRSEASTIQINESGSEVMHRQTHIPPLRLVTEGPMRIGTTLIQSNESPYQPMSATIEVTEYDPPRIFTLKLVSDLGTNYVKYQLQSNDDETFLIESIEMELGASMIAILDQFYSNFNSMIESQLKQGLLDLKKQLEIVAS